MIFNKLMVPLFKKFNHSLRISPRLLKIADAGFIEWYDCYLLKQFADSAPDGLKTVLGEEVGVECFINHVHMSDYVTTDFLSQASHLIQKINDKWNQSFKEKNWYLIFRLKSLA